MSGIANLIGTSEETFTQATGETAKEFEALPAGIYKAVIKSVLKYENQFGSTQMNYIVTVTTADNETKDVGFRTDIGATLKDKSENKGYANRFKQFMYAANVKDEDISIKEKSAKIKSFGKEFDADKILGMNGKSVLAEVLKMNDTTKAEGQSFKISNALSGVLATDGTDASGDNKAEDFAAKCEKTPLTDYAGYVKAGNAATASTATNTPDAKDAGEAGF